MFFYVRTTTYRARTGPVEARMPYPCAHCGVSATALVRTEGNASSVAVYGGGGSAEAAKKKAYEAAQANAVHALKTTACPNCGKLQPPILAQFGDAAKRLAWRRKIGVPLALGLAGLFGVSLAGVGIADRDHSAGALFVAFPLAFMVAAFGVGLARRRWASPLDKKTGTVWFWWTPPPTYREAGPAQWRPASPPREVPELRQPSRHAFVVGLLLAACGLVLSFVALGVKASMYEPVYVVNTSGNKDFGVKIDGRAVGSVSATEHGLDKDVAYQSFDVRSGQTHHIEVTTGGAPGSARTYDVAAKGGQGWLIAPDSLESELCILDELVVYGSGEVPDPEILNRHTDVIELSRSYDDFFEKPPTTMSSDASRVTRRVLRGYDCNSGDDNSPRSFWEKMSTKPH
jgi:hypothetical protein